MKKKTNKTLLIILLSIACALIFVGASFAIYDYVSNTTDSTQQGDDDGWTDNY